MIIYKNLKDRAKTLNIYALFTISYFTECLPFKILYFFNLVFNCFLHDCIFLWPNSRTIESDLLTKNKIKRQGTKI
jgi:hypothetical protein